MAAVASRDWTAFVEHWNTVLADPDLVKQTILADDHVAGYVASWPSEGQWLVGYWLGREFWGKGIATQALAMFLERVRIRPLHALVAGHNVGSRRVLEKCGFTLLETRREAADRSDVEELVMVLE